MSETVKALTETVPGGVITASDPDYDDDRAVYNAMHERKPRAETDRRRAKTRGRRPGNLLCLPRRGGRGDGAEGSQDQTKHAGPDRSRAVAERHRVARPPLGGVALGGSGRTITANESGHSIIKRISITAVVIALVALGGGGVAIAAVILGTSGHDRIFGTWTTDSVDALAGNDIVHGLGGNDSVYGSLGNDELWGDGVDANGQAVGTDGQDYIVGDEGDDRAYGGSAVDWLIGGAGNDVLFGNDGIDYLFGDNRFNGATGGDLLWGGHGRDELRGGPGGDRLTGGPDEDLLSDYEGGDDALYASNDGGASDEVYCGPGKDIAYVDVNDVFIFWFDSQRLPTSAGRAGCEIVRVQP